MNESKRRHLSVDSMHQCGRDPDGQENDQEGDQHYQDDTSVFAHTDPHNLHQMTVLMYGSNLNAVGIGLQLKPGTIGRHAATKRRQGLYQIENQGVSSGQVQNLQSTIPGQRHVRVQAGNAIVDVFC